MVKIDITTTIASATRSKQTNKGDKYVVIIIRIAVRMLLPYSTHNPNTHPIEARCCSGYSLFYCLLQLSFLSLRFVASFCCLTSFWSSFFPVNKLTLKTKPPLSLRVALPLSHSPFSHSRSRSLCASPSRTRLVNTFLVHT